MSKLTHHMDTDYAGRSFLVIEKDKGKLTVDEIQKYVLNSYGLRGYYVVVIRATESMTEGSGWFDTYETKGDSVQLYEYQGDEHCPVCYALATPDYCPHCGETIREGK